MGLRSPLFCSTRRRWALSLAVGTVFPAWAGWAQAQMPPSSLPTHRNVPGGVAVVALGGGDKPQVELEGHLGPILVLGMPEAWWAIVGLPLTDKAGSRHLRVTRGVTVDRLALAIEAQAYAEQRLSVAPQHVALSASDLARHERERKHQSTVMATVSPKLLTSSLRLQAPVQGRRSSSFGLRRVFNGQARNPHNGMDIAAPLGTPVVACASGVVLDVGDYFFNGNTVWLDHGQGLLSLVCHMHTVEARVGEVVHQGDRLGTVGATGRATGPHVHWSVMLNRAFVDPALFIDA